VVRRGTAGAGAATGADHPQFATASYAVIDRAAGTIAVANAGHLPVLVRRPGSATVAVHAAPGPPLGIGAGGYTELEVPFGPGCLLAAFTDGLVESRQVDADAGVELLRLQVDAGPVDDDLERTADRLLDTLDGRSGLDDVALLLLHQQD
jgi:serine phosphatase RsbU (regulator of sigma subunit)